MHGLSFRIININTSKNKVYSCKRCIMDSNDDPNINFNENGICNYCSEFDEEKKMKTYQMHKLHLSHPFQAPL